jgi:UPF0271 protein
VTSSEQRAIDLNADLGEDPSGADAALLEVVTTAHVACGFHAGNPELMRRTVARAVEVGVAVGAHPSYPDREGFGRREMGRHPERVAEDVVHQLGALDGIARLCGARVVSVKAHGALYHRLSEDPECAAAVAAAVAAFDRDLPLVFPAIAGALSPSAVEARAAVAAAGLSIRAEAFCDRRYGPDGRLVPRDAPGAIIVEPAAVGGQARSLALEGSVVIGESQVLPIRPDTLCVHGDTPGALALARAVRATLEDAGVRVAPAS